MRSWWDLGGCEVNGRGNMFIVRDQVRAVLSEFRKRGRMWCEEQDEVRDVSIILPLLIRLKRGSLDSSGVVQY